MNYQYMKIFSRSKTHFFKFKDDQDQKKGAMQTCYHQWLERSLTLITRRHVVEKSHFTNMQKVSLIFKHFYLPVGIFCDLEGCVSSSSELDDISPVTSSSNSAIEPCILPLCFSFLQQQMTRLHFFLLL